MLLKGILVYFIYNVIKRRGENSLRISKYQFSIKISIKKNFSFGNCLMDFKFLKGLVGLAKILSLNKGTYTKL